MSNQEFLARHIHKKKELLINNCGSLNWAQEVYLDHLAVCRDLSVDTASIVYEKAFMEA
jgi:hypothetical protein